MLIDYSSTVAYVCPECGQVSGKDINIFEFSGAKSVFCCFDKRCGTKCVSVRKRKEKYIFDIECPVCGETHTFPISCVNFWERDFLTFLCPVSDAEIFFKGNSEEIKAAIEDLSSKNTVSDEENVLYDMLEELYFLSADNSILCECGNKHIEISVLDGAVALVCKKCGAAKIIEINAKNHKEISNADSIIIKK